MLLLEHVLTKVYFSTFCIGSLLNSTKLLFKDRNTLYFFLNTVYNVGQKNLEFRVPTLHPAFSKSLKAAGLQGSFHNVCFLNFDNEHNFYLMDCKFKQRTGTTTGFLLGHWRTQVHIKCISRQVCNERQQIEKSSDKTNFKQTCHKTDI